MLGGKAGEIVSRREIPSQYGRVGSPASAEAEGKKCNFQTQFVQLPGFCQHFTENQFFISNKILTTIISIPPTFPLFFYDKILAIIMSIPPTFPVLMNLPKLL